MTNATVKKRKWRKVKLLGTIALGMCILFSACSDKQAEVALDIATDVLLDYLQQDGTESQPQQENLDQTKMEGEMSVHFIEVGQADATLFVQDGSAMLFDAATKSRGDDVYLATKKSKFMTFAHYQITSLSAENNCRLIYSSRVYRADEIFSLPKAGYRSFMRDFRFRHDL